MTAGLACLASCLLLVLPGQASAPSTKGPTAVIRGSNVRVSRILRRGHTITPADREEMTRILTEVTDFERVSARVLGPRWDAMPAAERADFTAAFVHLVTANAIAKMGQYHAERFEYLGETIEGDRAEVRTRAFFRGRASSTGPAVSLDYEMVRAGGRWRVVNYVLNGVDNGQSYRRQFDKILEKESVADLIGRLRKKAAELEKGGGG